MLRNLIVQAGLIGDLLDELAINILRYGDRKGGYALSVGCRGDDMTIALCDTMKSDAGAREESDARKSRSVQAPTTQGASAGKPSKDSDGTASDCSANGPSNGPSNGTAKSGTRLGLRGHARLIERHGGSMTWDQADGSFSLEAMIPLHDYTGAGD